jgi:hypothetical protein
VNVNGENIALTETSAGLSEVISYSFQVSVLKKTFIHYLVHTTLATILKSILMDVKSHRIFLSNWKNRDNK